MNLASGTRLGPYEIDSRIGAGGMGEVWKARDTRLDRSVAIKVLPAELVQNARLKARLEREAKAISRLAHPHICTLFDIGHENGIDYLVLELLEGGTLADRLFRGELSLDAALKTGAQIAAALDRAHRAGIIHRDLKPANIMLTKSGAKLLDFGLARSTEDLVAGETRSATQQKPVTEEGTVVGTFQYMAPEQLEGRAVDHRTDIFAFGAVLYEMITGKRAFAGTTRTSVAAAILGGQPQPVSELSPFTPPALEHLIAKCLEKDPDDRWQSAHDIAEELRWIGDAGSKAGVPASVRAHGKRSEIVAWSLAALAILIALIVAATTRWQKPVPPRQQLHASIPAPEGARYLLTHYDGASLTISPDGEYMTFKAPNDEGTPMLWLRRLSETTARPIPGTEGHLYPFWSPDSRQIAFAVPGKLKKTDLLGSVPVTLCDAQFARSGAWNEDGVILFSPDHLSPIHRVSADGGKAVAVTKLDASRETSHRWASFLPDGRHFLFLASHQRSRSETENNAIYVGDLETGERRFLLHARSHAVYASGHVLYYRGGALLAHPFDPKTRKLKGDPYPIVEHAAYDSGTSRATFAVSGDGRLLYQAAAKDKPRLVLLDRAGKELQTLGEGLCKEPRFSPDGTQVVCAIEDPSSGTSNLWVHRLRDGTRTRLTFGDANERYSAWSPDGASILFADDRRLGYLSDIYIKSVAGDEKERVLLETDANVEFPSWSSDGRYVAFVRTGRGDAKVGDIWILPMFGDRKPFPFIATELHETVPQFSPDGRWLAYTSVEGGRPEIFVTDFPDRAVKWQVSRGAKPPGLWRGSEIFHGLPDGTGAAVPVRTAGGRVTFGPPKPLMSQPLLIGVDVTADGQRFVVLNDAPREDKLIGLIENWPRRR